MSYKRFLDPTKDYTVSNAEIRLAREFHKKYVRGWESQKRFCLLQTVPDFYFSDVNLAIFLDGEQIHRNHEERDLELRDLLKKRYGCTVRSYSYKAPITKKRLAEIVEAITDDVLGLRRLQHG